jgi:SAM-dependent methyltransferase
MQSRARSFEEVATEYDRVRPGYPEALYDRVISFGNLTTAARVLEVGVGTGKATRPLAERGFSILGIEPGTSLTAQARSNLSRFPEVAVITSTFEDWEVETEAFGLAFAAQAYHWLDPKQRLAKFAAALRDGGVLAVFGHVPSVAPGPLRDAVDEVYARVAPELSQRQPAKAWYASLESPIMDDLVSSRDFTDADYEAFDWERSLDARKYETLLRTYSDHTALPANRLSALLSAVGDAIQKHGGSVMMSYRTGLFLARRITH